MTGRAAAAGLGLRAGFEIEWALGRGDRDGFAAAGRGPAYGMTRLVEVSDYARDILLALRRSGVEVEQLHPEYADGQYEVAIAPAAPVAAADLSVLVRQTVRAVSARHGYRVSYAPSVVAGVVGNGGHVHLSVSRGEDNLLAGGTGRYGMTEQGESFVAGILHLLPALVAVGAPTPASYLRLVPSHWAGAFACWGRETREAALRLVTGVAGTEARTANAEVKCFDLAANPYLAVGALIAAGLHGIDVGAPLPAEITGDPAHWPEEELQARGVRRLPQSLDEALDELADCQVLREAMGAVLFDAVIAVRRAEAARFRGAEPEQVVDALRWVY
jgi:glutamine synthetase